MKVTRCGASAIATAGWSKKPLAISGGKLIFYPFLLVTGS